MSIDQAPVGGNFDMGRVVKATFGAAKKYIITFFGRGITTNGCSPDRSFLGYERS